MQGQSVKKVAPRKRGVTIQQGEGDSDSDAEGGAAPGVLAVLGALLKKAKRAGSSKKESRGSSDESDFRDAPNSAFNQRLRTCSSC